MAPSEQLTEEPEAVQSAIGVWLGRLVLVLSLPPLALALCAMTGLGLDQNLPSQLALVGALCVVVLPALGLAATFGGGTIAHGLALASVSIGLLLAFPGYFPERRESATRVGLEYFSRHLGEDRRARVIELGLTLLGRFGPEPVRTIRAQPNDSSAARTDLEAESAQRKREEDRRSTWIPYEGDGQTIIIPAHIDGPNFGEQLRFVFDTGATLTTISKDVLELLDIAIPDDAPEVTLHTAAGEMQARLVLIDAIWLDEQVVEWITVAVCKHCASSNADGLLGLNVSSHFRVSIDHEAQEIELVPRRGRRNRRLDVQPWLELNSVLRRWEDGRLELVINVNNRAPRAIKRSVLEVKCSDELFTIHLDPIPALGSVSQPASLPWGTRCETFEVVPVAAAWETDRF
ncbi:MAG: hypothetical protein GY944_27425 [bacterium]|nr:hypothetical protein [bacterium]